MASSTTTSSSTRVGGLSQRLAFLHSWHRDEPIIWDIGCDHGHLGLSFAEHPLVKEIHLVDPSESVISVLNKTLDSYITNGQVFVHHMKGQEINITSLSPQLIFIAGMGGREMGEILSQQSSHFHADTRIVISPHRNVLELRQRLRDLDLRVESEALVSENGLYYPVIILSLKSSLPEVSPYGDDIWKGPLAMEWRNQQLRHFELHQDELSKDYCAFLKALNFPNSTTK